MSKAPKDPVVANGILVIYLPIPIPAKCSICYTGRKMGTYNCIQNIRRHFTRVHGVNTTRFECGVCGFTEETSKYPQKSVNAHIATEHPTAAPLDVEPPLTQNAEVPDRRSPAHGSRAILDSNTNLTAINGTQQTSNGRPCSPHNQQTLDSTR